MSPHFCFVDDDRKATACVCARGEDHTEDEFDVPASERLTPEPGA